MHTIRRYIILLYKVFFLGLLVHFFAHTFITFGLGIDFWWAQYIRLRKEAVIGIIGVITLAMLIRHKKRSFHLKFWGVNAYLLALLATTALFALAHFSMVGESIGAFIMAFKYDLLGFFIFLVAVHSGLLLTTKQQHNLILRYGTVIKYALLAGLVWYFIIFIKPGTLKLFGYNNWIFEGTVGSAPPAAYYTLINEGLTRNQFLFERPITWGFFLTAFWPIFYMLFLHKKPLSETRLWWVIYGMNIILTFSRAAWGVWIIQLFLLPILLNKGIDKKVMLRVGIPTLIVFLGISVIGFQEVINRGYSNYGHIAMVQQGREMFVQAPLRGNGGASAGPGSHRGGIAFNPENQFLQIFIEFGVAGGIPWTLLFIGLCLLGVAQYWKAASPVKSSNKSSNKSMSDSSERSMTESPNNSPAKSASDTHKYLLALSVGLIGLGISGMVLHSLSDRMVTYPFFALFGLVRARHLLSTCNLPNSAYNTNK